jgi:hypothetical protein
MVQSLLIALATALAEVEHPSKTLAFLSSHRGLSISMMKEFAILLTS